MRTSVSQWKKEFSHVIRCFPVVGCQGKSRAGKLFAKKKLVAGEIFTKKKFVTGIVPVGKVISVVKKVSAGPGCRQGQRQEGGSEPREQCNQVPRQACWTGARKRQGGQDALQCCGKEEGRTQRQDRPPGT